MTVRIEITGDTAADVRKQMLDLIGGNPVTFVPELPTVDGKPIEVADEVEETKKVVETKKVPPKKTPEKAKEPEKKPEPEPEPTDGDEVGENPKDEDTDSEQTEVTYEDLQKAMLRLTKAYNLDREKAAGILKHFGVGHGADLKKSDYPEAFRMAEDLIAKAPK